MTGRHFIIALLVGVLACPPPALAGGVVGSAGPSEKAVVRGVALVQERCFYHLEAPIERVTGWDTPYPHAQEWAYFPGPDRVGKALKRVMEA